MSDHIKSKELCDRCRFEYFRNCSEKNGCGDCEMDATGKPGGCKCFTVDWNTPCPYFEEAEDDE